MSLQTMDFSVTEKSGHGRITYTYIIRVTENKVDVIKNTSHVTVEAILKQSYSGTAFSGYRTGVSCTVNAETLFSDYCRRTISGKKEHVFYTWQGELPHAPDGTLVLQVEGKLWQTKKADYTPPTMAPQGEMALTPIARASRVGAADGVIGSRTTVVITPWVPEAAHTIHYQFGEEQGYITADGSISPEAALENAAQILKDHLQVFLGGQPVEKDAREMMSDEDLKVFKLLAQDVDTLDLSVRAMNCLNNANIKLIGELCTKSESRMLKYRNFGKKSLDEIKEKIDKLGLSLGMTFSDTLLAALELESAKVRLEPEEEQEEK